MVSQRRILVAILAVTLLFSSPALSLADNRSEADAPFHPLSEMPLGYGNETESFDDPTNTSLHGSTIIEGGNLTLSDIHHQADFDDGTYQGWKQGQDSTEVNGGSLRCYDRGSVNMGVNLTNLILTYKVRLDSYTGSRGEGFSVVLYGPPDDYFSAQLLTENNTFVFRKRTLYQYFDIGYVPFTPEQDRWYSVELTHTGTSFTFSVDGNELIKTKVDTLTKVDNILMGTEGNSDVRFDNTTIRSGDTKGHAYTTIVQRPFNRWWEKVEIKYIEHGESKVTFSVMDSYLNRPHFTRYENMTGSVADITGLIPTDSDRLHLDIWLTGKDYAFPVVEWVRISWKPDPPYHSESLPESFEVNEDEPVEDIWNLTKGTGDWYVPDSNLTYEVSYVSNTSHVLPIILGQNLSIELPTRDWHGRETFRFRFSDGEFETESPNITVVVLPVNDAPVVGPPGTFEAVEEQVSTLNLTPFLSDVDFPVEDLTVRTDSPNCTVVGQNLTFNYSVGRITENVTFWVSDGELEVNATLNVTVRNVNDAPSVAPVLTQYSKEEEVFTVDLSTYLADEDDPIVALTVSSDDPFVVSVEDRILTFLHDDWVDVRMVNFTVSDGNATVNGSFRIWVEAINDAPVFVSVGGTDIASIETIEVSEGVEVWLPTVVEDVDSTDFSYYLQTDLGDAEVFSNGTLYFRAVHGVLGEFWASIVVDDQNGGTDELNITIVIENVNDPPSIPIITSPLNGSEVDEGENVTFGLSFDDPDLVLGQVLDITWSSNISGHLATFTSEDVVPFTLDVLAIGTHLVTVTVSDGEFVASSNVWFTVKPVQVPGPGPGPGPGPVNGNGNGNGGEEPIIRIGVIAGIVMAIVVVVVILIKILWKR